MKNEVNIRQFNGIDDCIRKVMKDIMTDQEIVYSFEIYNLFWTKDFKSDKCVEHLEENNYIDDETNSLWFDDQDPNDMRKFIRIWIAKNLKTNSGSYKFTKTNTLRYTTPIRCFEFNFYSFEPKIIK